MTNDLLTTHPSAQTASAELEELRLRLHMFEHEVARLEKERLEYELMSRRLVGELDQPVLEALRERLRQRQTLPEALRDGRLLTPGEIPPEAVLDLAETIYWRHALAEATGLQTFLYLRDENGFRPAANGAAQLPSLARCDEACREGVDAAVASLRDLRHSHQGVCAGCGRELWFAPLVLRHGEQDAILGCLAGHDPGEPRDAMRRMVSLIANLAGQRASETYAGQLDAVVQMSVSALIHRHTEDQAASVRDARVAVLEQERSARDLAMVRANLETALAQAGEARSEAERANRIKSLFLAAMSHEIRTPLTCVIGFADLLTLPTLGEDEVRQFANSIKESGHVLMSLINNVLDLSKIEAGRLDLERIPFDLRRILQEIETIFSTAAADKQLDFALNVDASLPETFMGDPTRVRQVIMNLVGNAIKFTREGGVEVGCRCDASTPGFLVLTVRDTGFGIAAERLPHIFDAFRQAEQGTTRKFGGTGLGLAISQRIATAMGGELSVESEEGEGSVFTCLIPVEMDEHRTGS